MRGQEYDLAFDAAWVALIKATTVNDE